MLQREFFRLGAIWERNIGCTSFATVPNTLDTRLTDAGRRVQVRRLPVSELDTKTKLENEKRT